ARVPRTDAARVTKRPGASSTPTVSLMMSSSPRASSNTNTSCSGIVAPPAPPPVPHDALEPVRLVEHHHVVLGDDRAAGADVDAVEMRVHDDDVADLGAVAGELGPALAAHRAAVSTRALVAADAHRPPRRVRRAPVE